MAEHQHQIRNARKCIVRGIKRSGVAHLLVLYFTRNGTPPLPSTKVAVECNDLQPYIYFITVTRTGLVLLPGVDVRGSIYLVIKS